MSDTAKAPFALGHALLAYAIPVGIVLALFGRVVGHPFIAFDDIEYILRNPQVSATDSPLVDRLLTPTTGYIVPVTIAVERLLYRVSGGEPWSFHAAALVLHALYVCQLLAFARRLGAVWSVAFAAALLFAVHPLVVQPVAWAICIKDLLMANLMLAATRAFLTCVGPPASGRAGALAVVLALAAMLAKPTAALVGFAWLAFLAARRLAHAQGGADPLGDEPARPALAAAGVTAVLGGLVGAASRFAHDAQLEQAVAWTPWKPVVVLGRQVWNTLWPADLLIVYPDPIDHPSPLLGALGIAALLGLALLVVRLRASPPHLLPVALALVTYVPTSNLLPFARTMSDSYMYVPLSGMLVAGALLLGKRLAARAPSARRLAAVAAAALGLALAASSSVQLPRWRGGTTLWHPVVRRYPDLGPAQRLLGDEMVLRGRPDLAVEPYRRALARDYDTRFLLEFGTVLSMAGRIADAECVLIEAVAFGNDTGYAIYNYAALLAFHPEYAPRHAGVAHQLLGRLDALRRAGKVRWPPALEAGLQAQIERVRSAPPPPPWTRRQCAMLARK